MKRQAEKGNRKLGMIKVIEKTLIEIIKKLKMSRLRYRVKYARKIKCSCVKATTANTFNAIYRAVKAIHVE